jgi:hypothetical protein
MKGKAYMHGLLMQIAKFAQRQEDQGVWRGALNKSRVGHNGLGQTYSGFTRLLNVNVGYGETVKSQLSPELFLLGPFQGPEILQSCHQM